MIAKKRDEEVRVNAIKFTFGNVRECLALHTLAIEEAAKGNALIFFTGIVEKVRCASSAGHATIVKTLFVSAICGRQSEPLREGTGIATNVVETAVVEIGHGVGEAEDRLTIRIRRELNVGTLIRAFGIENGEF